MRCDKCHKKVDKAYLKNGELLCWLCAGGETRATEKMVNHVPEKVEQKTAEVKVAAKPPGIGPFIYSLLEKNPDYHSEIILQQVLEAFPDAKITKACIAGYKAQYSKQNGLIKASPEVSFYQAVRRLGGAAPHKKGMPGALMAEYNAVVPIHCRRGKAKGGRPLDELAAALSKEYPQFGIENENDLLEAFKGEEAARTNSVIRGE